VRSYPIEIVGEAVLNGLLTGSIYGLVALGLTLVYGVLHIINFAHGALLTLAMYAAFVAWKVFGLDPYVAILPLVPMFFLLGYGVQRFVIGPASRGEDSNILLVTLGLSIVIENLMLAIFRSDTLTVQVPYAMEVVELGPMLLSVPRVAGFGVAFVAPPPALCTDNAAMIAWAGIERLQLGLVDGLDIACRPRWPLDTLAA
jgi:branched-chain amino acid transport system permease protein